MFEKYDIEIQKQEKKYILYKKYIIYFFPLNFDVSYRCYENIMERGMQIIWQEISM